MSIEFKDYYQILGIPRTAGQDEIKQAYRKLARKYHPDVSGGKPGTEERFKEINEAYEVLKDPAKRKKYDSMGSGFDPEREFRPPRGSSGRPGGGTRGGFGVGGTGFSDFFEVFFGSRRMGTDPFGGGVPFGESGTGMGGRRRTGPVRGSDLEADILVTLEEAIRGSTRQVSVDRGVTGGNGGRIETYQVKIPPGVRQGQRIRLAGKGEAGSGPGVASGDLYLRVRLSEDPFFRVEGDDLYYDLALDPWDAVLGTAVEIPAPSGKVSLRIPAGTSSGKQFRLRHLGMPRAGGARGDLYAVARIRIPTRLTPRERELWGALRAARIDDRR